MQNFYTVKPGETMWAASDVGWQVGHSYIAYGPMIHGATATLYEGKPVGTPDAGAFWRVISQHRIPVLFTAPTAFRAIKREDPHGELLKKYDLSHFRALFLAGERCDPDTLHWAEDLSLIHILNSRRATGRFGRAISINARWLCWLWAIGKRRGSP